MKRTKSVIEPPKVAPTGFVPMTSWSPFLQSILREYHRLLPSNDQFRRQQRGGVEMYVEQSHHLVRCYNIGEPAGSAKRTEQGPTRKTMPESKLPPRRQKESILHRYYARPFKEIYCYGNRGVLAQCRFWSRRTVWIVFDSLCRPSLSCPGNLPSVRM